MDIYDKLWREAAAAFADGKVELDPFLPHKAGDERRGATLIARPAPAVRDRVAAWLQQLDAACPGQHLYRPEELHVTVMSILPLADDDGAINETKQVDPRNGDDKLDRLGSNAADANGTGTAPTA